MQPSHLVFGAQNAAIASQLLPQPPLLAKWALSGYESFRLSEKVKKKKKVLQGCDSSVLFLSIPHTGSLG